MPEGARELRLAVTAPDYDEALRFYRDVLGLREEATFSSDGGRVTILGAGRATLEISDPTYAAYIDEVEVGRRVAGQIRVAFEVRDAAAVTRSLESAGARVVAEPVRTPWDSLNARLDGPAGLHLTVFTPDIYVAPRTRLDGKVVLAEPDPAWAATAAGLVSGIREALGPTVMLVEHVGSTAVPDLPAKPLIDLLLLVPDPPDEDAYVPALEPLGYELRIREPDWHQHRLLKRSDPEVNLHVFGVGSEEADRMLAFRDHLRADRRDLELYAATKRDLADREWEFVQDYADAKSEVVAEIMSRAPARATATGGFYVLVSGPPASGRAAVARSLAEQLGLPLLAQQAIDRALSHELDVRDEDGSSRLGRAGSAAVLAIAADIDGAVLDGGWQPGHSAAIAALPAPVIEVCCRVGEGSPVAGGWPVLEVDTSSEAVDLARLVRRVRQIATRGNP